MLSDNMFFAAIQVLVLFFAVEIVWSVSATMLFKAYFNAKLDYMRNIVQTDNFINGKDCTQSGYRSDDGLDENDPPNGE